MDSNTVNQMVEKLFELEGGMSDLEHDRGGPTAYGVSSTWYPEQYEKIRNGEWSKSDVANFYIREFAEPISKFGALSERFPAIAYLLFTGSVHGTGIGDYTALIQEWLNDRNWDLEVDGVWGPRTARAVLALSQEQQVQLLEAIANREDLLADDRASSVGAYEEGIKNRVRREISQALTFHIDSNVGGHLAQVEWIQRSLEGKVFYEKV